MVSFVKDRIPDGQSSIGAEFPQEGVIAQADCGPGSCNTACKSCEVPSCGEGLVSAVSNPDVCLATVMGFMFPDLIDRMVEKYGWTKTEAELVFEDTKRFLYLCGTGTQVVAPSPKIDEVWHNFILYTEDYLAFCKTQFGRFIHHRPRRKSDAPSKRDLVHETLSLAQATFGHLSTAWNYVAKDGTIIEANSIGTISNAPEDCQQCEGSTNCQD